MAKRGTGAIRKVGDSILARIPYEVRNDDEFPFEIGDEVEIAIVPDTDDKKKKMLTIRKV